MSIGKNIRQVNQYDKIIRENLEITLPVIISDVLQLSIQQSEELPDDVQHTKERRPDALKKVRDIEGNSYILHIEFQVEDDKDMVYRMAEYSTMLRRHYKLPVKQYVIFLKERKPKMVNILDDDDFKFRYTVICISDVNFRLFLKSKFPEVKMLGILANLDSENDSEVIVSIVAGINAAVVGDLARQRYYNQLRVLAQLRIGLNEKFQNIMQSISTFFKDENDFLYQKGEKIGLEKGILQGEKRGESKKNRAIVTNMISLSNLSNKEIANIAEVSISLVRRIRAKLSNQQM